LEAHRNSEVKFEVIQPRNTNIRIYDDQAVEQDLALVKGTYKGEDFSGVYGGTRTWRKVNGEWRIAMFQVFSADPEAARQ
jgi:hypothetical protein